MGGVPQTATHSMRIFEGNAVAPSSQPGPLQPATKEGKADISPHVDQPEPGSKDACKVGSQTGWRLACVRVVQLPSAELMLELVLCTH